MSDEASTREIEELIQSTKLELVKALGREDIELVPSKDPRDYGYVALDSANSNWLLRSTTRSQFGTQPTIASFRIMQLPGCCGVCLSYNAQVYSGFRKKGVAKILHNFRLNLARMTGYTVMLCTDVNNNVPQRKILQKNGWKDLASFINKRTKHNVNISLKVL